MNFLLFCLHISANLAQFIMRARGRMLLCGAGSASVHRRFSMTATCILIYSYVGWRRGKHARIYICPVGVENNDVCYRIQMAPFFQGRMCICVSLLVPLEYGRAGRKIFLKCSSFSRVIHVLVQSPCMLDTQRLSGSLEWVLLKLVFICVRVCWHEWYRFVNYVYLGLI